MGAADLSQRLGSFISSGGAPDGPLLPASSASRLCSRSTRGEPTRGSWALEPEAHRLSCVWVEEDSGTVLRGGA